jgi:hypothetical protein
MNDYYYSNREAILKQRKTYRQYKITHDPDYKDKIKKYQRQYYLMKRKMYYEKSYIRKQEEIEEIEEEQKETRISPDINDNIVSIIMSN